MMRQRIDLFRIFGFPIRVDLSWILILLLVTYSLAVGYFPENHPGMPKTAYWARGCVAAMGLFASILFHELSHSLVARHFKIQINGITLFIFGGVAEMKEESPSSKVEFWVAVVGPIASLLLGFGFLKLSSYGDSLHWNKPLVLIFYYLGFMNMLLALFNMVPAFPLDGGRVFRSLMWALKKDYFWATRLAARMGQIFGWILVGLGAIEWVRGSPFGGVWYILIGLFLRQAAQNALTRLTSNPPEQGEEKKPDSE
jgi:Zn-dependent protease